MKHERKLYFDWLRVFAMFAVVMLHVSGAWFSNVDIASMNWNISVIFDSATRWAVPMFVMISGLLFLNRDISVKTLYTKDIFRIVTAVVAWSLLYAIITDPTANVKGFVVNVLYGHYHMWFCYMIIGLYITVPVLKQIVENTEVTKYFLGGVLLIAFCIPQMIEMTQLLSGAIRLSGEC